MGKIVLLWNWNIYERRTVILVLTASPDRNGNPFEKRIARSKAQGNSFCKRLKWIAGLASYKKQKSPDESRL